MALKVIKVGAEAGGEDQRGPVYPSPRREASLEASLTRGRMLAGPEQQTQRDQMSPGIPDIPDGSPPCPQCSRLQICGLGRFTLETSAAFRGGQITATGLPGTAL